MEVSGARNKPAAVTGRRTIGRERRRSLGTLAAVLFGGSLTFAPSSGADHKDTQKPMPWTRITAHWNNGTLPPPHRRSGVLDVQADGTFTRTERRGYGDDAANAEVSEGMIDTAALSALTNRLEALGLWTIRWQEAERHPVGGSMRWVIVSEPDGRVAVPAFPVDAQVEAARNIVDAVLGAAPRQPQSSRTP